jgi:ribonuclease HII
MLNLKELNIMDMFNYENNARLDGINIICGIDEAGRGPLAGAVYAAAVILPEGLNIDGLNDSKQVPEKKRELLFDIIKEKAIDFCIASASENEIDTYNILNATFIAMKRAVAGLKIKPEIIFVDGNQDPKFEIPTLCIVKGDSKSASIAAASILAKVARDRYMVELDKQYPQYMFAKHKGYPTKLHYEMIEKYGISPIHRLSFLKKILNSSKENL